MCTMGRGHVFYCYAIIDYYATLHTAVRQENISVHIQCIIAPRKEVYELLLLAHTHTHTHAHTHTHCMARYSIDL